VRRLALPEEHVQGFLEWICGSLASSGLGSFQAYLRGTPGVVSAHLAQAAWEIDGHVTQRRRIPSQLPELVTVWPPPTVLGVLGLGVVLRWPEGGPLDCAVMVEEGQEAELVAQVGRPGPSQWVVQFLPAWLGLVKPLVG